MGVSGIFGVRRWRWSLWLWVWMAFGESAIADPPQTELIPGMGVLWPLLDELSYELSVSASNRYVTEGIDNVPGTPFVFTEAKVDFRGVEVGIWYATALEEVYNEADPYFQYTLDLDPVTIYCGACYVWYISADDADSWEVFGGVEYMPVKYITVFVEGYYDWAQIGGGFLETGVTGHVPFPDERVSINPYVMLGVDCGYVSGVRCMKENNFQFGIEAEFALTSSMTIFGYVNRTVSLANLRAIDEGNVTWGGSGIRLTF